MFKLCHWIEIFFASMKVYRGIATRHNNSDNSYAAAGTLRA